MLKLLSLVLLTPATAVAMCVSGSSAAGAASPSPYASCIAALSQGGTPNGISESDPGFLGAFVAGEAHDNGGVGAGTSAAAVTHGDLFACLPS